MMTKNSEPQARFYHASVTPVPLGPFKFWVWSIDITHTEADEIRDSFSGWAVSQNRAYNRVTRKLTKLMQPHWPR